MSDKEQNADKQSELSDTMQMPRVSVEETPKLATANKSDGWSTRTTVLVMATVLALVVGSLWFAWGASGISKASADGIAAVTVSDEDVAGAVDQVCPSKLFVNNSLLPVGKGRLWSDSVSTPFAAKTPEAIRAEDEAELCQNPVLLASRAEALIDKEHQLVIAGKTMSEINPWLKQIVSVYGDGNPNNVLTKGTYKEQGDAILVKDDYRKLATKMVLLMRVLSNEGIKTTASVKNWQLLPEIGILPHVAVSDKQENRSYLALAFTTKANADSKCPAYVLGINLEDKRPEYVSCEVAKKIAPKPTPLKPRSKTPPKPTKPTVPSHPGLNVPPVTPPPPDKPTPPSETPKPKDPHKAPKAPIGGGKNANPGPGEVTKPTQPPATPRVNPAPPRKSGHSTPAKPPRVPDKPKPAHPTPVKPSKQPVNNGVVDGDD